MKNKKLWIIISAISGFTAVAIGAFGAHGLHEQLSPEMIEIYKTGVLYQFIHTIVLLIISFNNTINGKIPSVFLILGIILFSFSLYIYSTFGIQFLALITPIGGVCFLIGWLWIIIETFRIKVSN